MMSSSPTPSSSGALHEEAMYATDEMTSTSSSGQYMHHLTSNTVDQNVVSSTQHNQSHNHNSHQQPFKHMLAQKYAAESTSEQSSAGSSSETGQQLHHNLQQFYAYSPLVSSSCSGHHFEANMLDTNNVQNDVIHVESTSGQLDSEDSQLMQNSVFHDNVIESLIKQEQQQQQTSTLVTSTSTANMCRQDMIFDCNSEAVDSTTSAGHQMSYIQPMHTYQEQSIDKIAIQSLVSMQTDSHQLMQTHYLHQNADNSMPILQPQTVEQCVQQPMEEAVVAQHNPNPLPIEMDIPQEHVINDLPVLSRARASLPAEYLYIEEPDNSATVFGVFAKKTIPKRTQFGPVEGVIAVVAQHNPNPLPIEMDIPQEHVISDLPVLSRARASLPAEYLYIEEPDNSATVFGVFAKKTIPKRTQFGPVEGVIVGHNHSNVHNLNHNLMIFITEDLILDQSDENQSNWMKFVRSANTYEEQNLSLIAKENVSANEIEIKFFFLTTRAIYAREELKVWYSREYADKYNLKALEGPLIIADTDEQSVAEAIVQKSTPNPIDILTTGGHKLRNKIAKTLQQQQLQQQQQQTLDTQQSSSQTDANGSSGQPKDTTAPPKYQCETCQKIFPRFYSLRRHQIMHSGEKKYKCPVCGMSFSHVYNRNRHAKKHQKAVTNKKSKAIGLCYLSEEISQQFCPFVSLENPQGFDEFSAVRKHIRAFHSDKQYPCTQCEKVFPRPDKLKLHMLRHSDHREFLCANCGKQFKRKDKLKEHMQRMHAPDREAKLAAKQAAKQAQQLSQQHKKFIPKVSPTDYHRFIYKCHTCLLGFKRRGMLVNHLAKRHPDIPPDTVPELNLPILKTTRDYYCQYCDKVYKSSSKRKAHIMKNHPGKSLPLSNRHKGGIPVIPGIPNPTYSAT
ncbi:unnamed protein product, partial [Medioppia subpectinata]